jgi:hypothetical protein
MLNNGIDNLHLLDSVNSGFFPNPPVFCQSRQELLIQHHLQPQHETALAAAAYYCDYD